MDFLVRGFTFLGFEFQNWMPITAGLLAVAIIGLYLWDR
jgi:hypothetical protein